jgi:hypothetical protein
MSDLTSIEKLKLERLLEMGGGYVLDLSNRAFEQFVLENIGVSIYLEKYDYASGSKANRLRQFWNVEGNYIVGRLLDALLERWRFLNLLSDSDPTPQLYTECEGIVRRLLDGSAIDLLGAIEPFSDQREVSLLEKQIRTSLLNNEPVAALDRLHTYAVKFIRRVSDQNSLKYSEDTPLHGLYGQYVKHLAKEGLIESEMTQRILKTFISLLEQFNHVRNRESLAHDNTVVNHQEGELIVSAVLLVIKFVRSIEEVRTDEYTSESDKKVEFDDIPF